MTESLGHRFRRWLALRRVPQPWPKGAVRCPACGRAIAGATRPDPKASHVIARPMVLPHTDDDLIARCAVDGELGDGLVAQPIDVDEMIRTTLSIAAACDAVDQLGWGAMLRNAAERDDDREVYIGHALALFRRKGPIGGDSGVQVDDASLRQLIHDVVSQWEPLP